MYRKNVLTIGRIIFGIDRPTISILGVGRLITLCFEKKNLECLGIFLASMDSMIECTAVGVDIFIWTIIDNVAIFPEKKNSIIINNRVIR
jgi:hypothetical protein